jgi:acyl-CoA thioesterase I
MMRSIRTLLTLCVLAGAPLVAAAPPAVLVFGDSLSTAYGLSQDKGWVALLQQRLARQNPEAKVINASVTGETTSGGAARIRDALQRHRPTHVIVALGGNDGLRGLPVKTIRANLETILRTIEMNGAKALLVGIRLPPNYGPSYTKQFDLLYRDLSAARKVPLVPFLLEGLGEGREFFQADGIHPTAAAQPTLLENIWPALRKILEKPTTRRGHAVPMARAG